MRAEGYAFLAISIVNDLLSRRNLRMRILSLDQYRHQGNRRKDSCQQRHHSDPQLRPSVADFFVLGSTLQRVSAGKVPASIEILTKNQG
jgi:hypothetical protein